MEEMMSVCGVLCSGCPAYLGRTKGIAHQRRTAAAWMRIYGLSEAPQNISCGGCLGPDADLFHTSRTCRARNCALAKAYRSCAQCHVEPCPDLEKAQSVWDEVPSLAETLSQADFVAYAQPYCGHRRRLAEARAARR